MRPRLLPRLGHISAVKPVTCAPAPEVAVMREKIKYESLAKWKYRLTDDLELQCSVRGIACRTEYISLWDDGRLILRKHYAWDGASGPTIDTESSMRGSAGHDALYQLIRLRAIPVRLRDLADKDLHRWLIEDGMLAVRADYWYEGVRLFGGLHI